MATLITTVAQNSDKSILDLSGKQTYLGNQYSVNKSFTISTSEIPLLYLNNVQTSAATKALFQSLLRVALETNTNELTINVYVNPTLSGGSTVTPLNMRTSYGIANMVATVVSSPTVSSIGTLIDTISASPGQAVSESNLLKILDNGQSLLITGIASGTGTLCNVVLAWYEL